MIVWNDRAMEELKRSITQPIAARMQGWATDGRIDSVAIDGVFVAIGAWERELGGDAPVLRLAMRAASGNTH